MKSTLIDRRGKRESAAAMRDGSPIVTVVIPTRNRPALVLRAVKSALQQTLAGIEVIVVVDGPDPKTVAALATIGDARLHTIPLPTSVGGSDARNIGVQKGRGEFVALLDDDDEWVAHKLSAQLTVARTSKHPYPVVTSRLIARRPNGDEVWPHRPMHEGESMSEYLFCRENSIRQGEGFIQTSTLLMPRELMLKIPFTSGLQRHQDWDWLIRASACPGVEVLSVWEALTIYYIDAHRKSVSAGGSANLSTDWVDANNLVTAKARAYFYATQLAARCDSLGSFFAMVSNTIRYPRAFLIGLGLALIPRSLVSHMRTGKTATNA
jgi:glycosyltransferase involved in cell wall biosynthesis